MPLVIGGNVINVEDMQKQSAQVNEPTLSYEEIRLAAERQAMRNNARKVVPATPRIQANPEDHLVVVGGKVKKIGKQSKYLLDMLTIDD